MWNVRVLDPRCAVLAVALATASCNGGNGGDGSTNEQPIAAPTELTATASSSTAITLSWTDQSSDESGFRIERASATSGPFTEAAKVGADVSEWDATGLVPSTAYFFRVVAVASGRESAPSSVASASTRAALQSSVAFHDVSWAGFPAAGQGPLAEISFAPAVPPVFEENPGKPEGCKVWELTPAQASAAVIGEDQGPVQLTVADGSSPFPPCTWAAGAGYRCVARTGIGGEIVPAGQPGLWALVDADGYFEAADVGRQLAIAGASAPGNAGSFGIVARSGPTTILFASTSAAIETLPFTATWTISAGRGPVPWIQGPGLLADDDTVSVALTSAGNLAIDSFGSSALDAGDDFELDAASAVLISALPTDGSGFSLGCEGDGGSCGAGDATVLSIVTTDGTIPAGAPGWEMPPPATESVQVRCVSPGTTSATVPAAVSAYIGESGATRIETRLSRSSVALPVTNEPVTVTVGHAVIGWTTP